jgi:nucleotide-binding universal stress UspA family protein
MKKFIAVFDGFKMSESTLEYAIQLSKLADAHLVGVFIEDFLYHSYSIYHVLETSEKAKELIKELNEEDKKTRDEAALKFQKACEKAKLNFSIHRDKGLALQELLHESIFADLIIINENDDFRRKEEESPTSFMKELLRDIQCPVLVVPNIVRAIDKVVLLYDGSPSSVYAIKSFSYIFDKILNVPIEVFTVRDQFMEKKRLPDNKLMREFMKRHFSVITYTVEKGDATEGIIAHFQNFGENVLVVLGAYRRSDFSRKFKTSMADILMKELGTLLFIAHNK